VKTGWLAHDGAMWRRLAWLGASYGPLWWLRYSPPAFGLAAAVLVPGARRAVASNLRRVRGDVPRMREALDVAQTFATYAGCLAEGLANGSKNGAVPDIECDSMHRVRDALAKGRGVILVTAHTAGWELTGPGLARDLGAPVMMAMEAERSAGARDLQDDTRRATGLGVVHVGADPLASIALLHHLRKGGAVALQIDRLPAGMRGRAVRLLGGEGRMPEGPLRLAELTGAPIVPVFSARLGFRRYAVEASEPVWLARGAGEEARGAAAQHMADALTRFLQAHPTQWLDFGSR
jgi:lauroyl/myristoyl acyltransferase